VQQCRHHRGIDTPGESKQHPRFADLRAHTGDRIFDDVAGVPARLAAADLVCVTSG
jgi:hypothetical protein